MKVGLVLGQMEDKWFIYWHDDALYFHRSWSGFCIYVVRFETGDDSCRMFESVLNREPDQYSETSDSHAAAMISYLIDVLLLEREADFPTDAADRGEAALEQWSQVGRAMLDQHREQSFEEFRRACENGHVEFGPTVVATGELYEQLIKGGDSVERDEEATDFEPTEVRYIKLGRGGKWEDRCLNHDQTVMLGYNSPHHTNAIGGEWEKVHDYWLKQKNGKAGVATSCVNQIKDFYTLPETALWVTFHARHLYWCFADAHVEELPGGERVRKAIGGWRRESLAKEPKPLRIENLDGRVTKVQGYWGTICSVELEDYLIRKIRGEDQPDVQAAAQAHDQLKGCLASLIEGLWWKDFELLVDLVFAQAGWQRVSVLGKSEKDLDLDLLAPVTRKRAFVQVKSSATLATLEESVAAFRSTSGFDEMYFVVHTADSALRDHASTGVTVIDLPELAALVLSAGLVDWLITRANRGQV